MRCDILCAIYGHFALFIELTYHYCKPCVLSSISMHLQGCDIFGTQRHVGYWISSSISISLNHVLLGGTIQANNSWLVKHASHSTVLSTSTTFEGELPWLWDRNIIWYSSMLDFLKRRSALNDLNLASKPMSSQNGLFQLPGLHLVTFRSVSRGYGHCISPNEKLEELHISLFHPLRWS
jgi:hypothetical protein